MLYVHNMLPQGGDFVNTNEICFYGEMEIILIVLCSDDDFQVWVNAAAQTFNSLGIAFGGIITMSSYNKRKNKIMK